MARQDDTKRVFDRLDLQDRWGVPIAFLVDRHGVGPRTNLKGESTIAVGTRLSDDRSRGVDRPYTHRTREWAAIVASEVIGGQVLSGEA